MLPGDSGVRNLGHLRRLHRTPAASTRARHSRAPGVSPRTDTPPEALEPFRANVMRLTCISGLSGLPQVTMPIGTVSGCPVGLSFIGWSGGDEALLDFAAGLSRHCGR